MHMYHTEPFSMINPKNTKIIILYKFGPHPSTLRVMIKFIKEKESKNLTRKNENFKF